MAKVAAKKHPTILNSNIRVSVGTVHSMGRFYFRIHADVPPKDKNGYWEDLVTLNLEPKDFKAFIKSAQKTYEEAMEERQDYKEYEKIRAKRKAKKGKK